MADTITEFSNLTGKTFTEMKAGVSLASTTGSQTAVIRDVAIKNTNGRTVKLKIGSSTGMEVASSSATKDVLSGTELIKASSALVLHTEQAQ